MKLYYDEGQTIVSFGVAGEFRLGVPKEVPDDLAEILLRKGRLKKWPEQDESATSTQSKKKGKEE